MFDTHLVNVIGLPVEPLVAGVEPARAAVVGLGGAGFAMSADHDVIESKADLFGTEGHDEVVGEEEQQGEMVPAVAEERAGASAAAIGFDGVGVGDPGGDIQGVDVLLGDDIARDHAINAPGPQTHLRVLRGFAQLAVAVLKHQAGLILGIDGHQLAELALMDAGENLLVGRHGAGLEINKEHLLLPGRRPSAFGNGHAAGHVHRDRLGAIDVFPRGYRGRRLLRMEIRRADDGHRVELLLQQALVGGKPGEAVARQYIELLAGRIHAVLEVIGERHHVVIAVLGEQLGDPRSPPAAADDAEVDLRVGFGAPNQLRLEHREPKGRRTGACEEFAARDVRAALPGRGIGVGIGCGCLGRVHGTR